MPALEIALRALVHREIAADAVAGAVVEVEPVLPQRAARERVEVDAARALGEPRRGDGDVPLQHQREALAHLARRLADGDGARDVGGAVEVLGAAVDEKQLARRELAVGRAR